MPRWTPYIIATVAACLAIFGLVSAMPVLNGIVTWERSLTDTLIQWLPWAVLAPCIFWLVARYPIWREGLVWRAGLHTATGIIFVVFAAWLSNSYLAPRIMAWVPGRHDFDNHGPRPDAPDNYHGGPDVHRPFHDRGPHGPPLEARVWFNIPIYLALASLGHAFVFFRGSQQRDRRAMELETQLERARLQALRMQLQPHFLFNTLNAISTLVQTEPQVAQEMIGSLGQMLRLSLDSGQEAEVQLEQELKFLDSYLEIAQARFGDRLKVDKKISPEALKALVPTFILQPLVENAVQHGIEPKLSRGTVEVHAERTANQVVISISDTGVGLAASAENGVTDGIGLSNTRARLQSLYPGRHGFSIRNRTDGGCVAELKIPFHTAPLPGNGGAEQHEHSDADR